MSGLGIDSLQAMAYEKAGQRYNNESEDVSFADRLREYYVDNTGIAGSIKNAKGAGITGAGKAGGVEGFARYFPTYKVITKVGNCDVSKGNWQRNDFPFWKYFQEGTAADALNSWQARGTNPSQLKPELQRNYSSIGPGKISILIPEKLQEKMDADPDYAEAIYRKVAKWKEDYDRRDNALAAGYGYDVAAFQFSKSYCMQLDEEGNVQNCTVCGSGGEITGPSKEEQRRFEVEQEIKRKKRQKYKKQLEEAAMKRSELEHRQRMEQYYKKFMAVEDDISGMAFYPSFLMMNTRLF